MKFVFCYCLLLSSATLFSQSGTDDRNLFIITTDGFRWQELFTGADSVILRNPAYVQDTALMKQMYWDTTAELRRKKLMPFLWSTVSQQGQLYGNRNCGNKMDVSNMYKISYPGYNEMFTGYPDPIFIPNVPLPNRNKNIFELLNEQKEFSGQVAAFSSWNIFSAILNKKRSHLPVNSGYEPMTDDGSLNNEIINETQENVLHKKNTRYDLLTYLGAREYIDEHHPRVVLISFGETDQFAHSGRYDLYLQQATEVDRMIAELWYAVQTSPFYKNKTSFIITTDHGRGKKPVSWYRHGILTSGSGQTWFAVMGPGIAPEGEIKTEGQAWQKQIAATMTSLLGISFPESKIGENALPLPMRTDQSLALTGAYPFF